MKRRYWVLVRLVLELGYGILLGFAFCCALFIYSLDWLLRHGV